MPAEYAEQQASEAIGLISGADDGAAEPMLGNIATADDVERCTSIDRQHRTEFSREDEVRPGVFVWLLTVAAGVSGLLFGYDTGVISATLVSIGTALSNAALTDLDKALITSSTSLLALLISPVSSVLADRLGRKTVMLLADVLFIVGALVQAAAGSVWIMIVGRGLVGIAVGAASFVAPLYIGELSPAKYRGQLVTIDVFCITLGQVVAYLIGWAFSEAGSSGWRWMVGLGAVPAATQFVLLLFMPETPRWLVKVGRVETARSVLHKVYDTAEQAPKIANAVLRSIELEVMAEAQAARSSAAPATMAQTWWSKIKSDWDELVGIGGHRRALAIACLLQGLQQLCGFNSLMYYSATIFSLVGFSSPILTSMSVALSNCLFTALAIVLIDLLGRRRILLYSIPWMIAGLALSAWGFRYIDLDHTEQSAAGAEIAVLIAIIVYVCAYASGLGNVPWQQGELFPLSVRSLGSGIATSTNWGANFIVGLTFLPMMNGLSPTWTFVLYAVICLLGWCAILLIYPETKGLTLEQTGELLKDDWGVRQSRRRD